MASGRLLWAVIFTLFTFCSADVSSRTIKTVLYPDCAKFQRCKDKIHPNATAPNVSFPNVAYVRMAAGNDVLHYVMSTIKHPSVLVVHTIGNGKEKLSFNWTHLLLANKTDMAGGIYINDTQTGNVTYSFAVTFSRLFEYDDIQDSANLESAQKLGNDTRWKIHDFSQFMWNNVTQGQGGRSIIFNTSHPQPHPYHNNTAGCMYFQFEINGNNGRDSDLPRLIYNANNTQMNFVLDKYVPLFSKSRFALEMTFTANHTSENMTIEETQSIDDEFSPGVFKVADWYSRIKSDERGYIQWKPVCYMAAKRARGVGTEVRHYELKSPSNVTGLESMLEESLAAAFFGDALNNSKKIVQSSTNMSFGLSQDGYYLKNNYTVWTASIGYGKAPVETISTMVIIIIAAGLGIPVVIMLLGSIYVCVKKRRNGYERLNGDISRNNPRLN